MVSRKLHATQTLTVQNFCDVQTGLKLSLIVGSSLTTLLSERKAVFSSYGGGNWFGSNWVGGRRYSSIRNDKWMDASTCTLEY